MIVAYWSGVDILVNPYHTDVYAKGNVYVRALRDCTVAVRHAQSFTYAADLTV